MNSLRPRALRLAAGATYQGDGRYLADLNEHYTVVGRPNGGYLQCVLANAVLTEASRVGSPHQVVTAITTNYVGAPELGEAEAEVEVRRIGKGATFAHVVLRQRGMVTNESVVTLGNMHPDATNRYHDTAPFDVAPREECPRSPSNANVGILSVQEQRLDPVCTTFARGEISDRAEVKGWMRLDDGDASWDVWSLLFASDALPPATFPIGSSGWVPTLQLSSYIRSVPVGEWLKVRQWCVVIEDGLVDERCELFDERDRLVASSSQLAMVRFDT